MLENAVDANGEAGTRDKHPKRKHSTATWRPAVCVDRVDDMIGDKRQQSAMALLRYTFDLLSSLVAWLRDRFLTNVVASITCSSASPDAHGPLPVRYIWARDLNE